jgi:hypothetical protein
MGCAATLVVAPFLGPSPTFSTYRTGKTKGRCLVTNIKTAMSLISNPRETFSELRKTPTFWFPLSLMVISTAAFVFWYYSIVDFDWLKHQLMESNSTFRQMSNSDKARLTSKMSRNVLMWSTLITSILRIPIFRSLESAYCLIVGNLFDIRISYKHWFSFDCWTTLPVVLAIVPSFILLMTRQSNQIGADELQVLTANALLFHRAPGQQGYTLFSSITLLHPLVWALQIYGVRSWSARSWLFSGLFVLVPIVLCYGLWLVLAFSK